MLFELMELEESTLATCEACPRRARYRCHYRTRSGTSNLYLCAAHALGSAKELVRALGARLIGG